MPKNKVSDPITDREMTFARLVLSGAMTDRQAAEAAGLNPDSAAYIKSKPSVRAYMREHRAAVEQQLRQQEAEGLHRLNLDREKVLDRLWEIANLSPEMTRSSITGQVKALSMIIAMQNFIPDPRALSRLAVSSEKKSPPSPAHPQTFTTLWQAETCDPQSSLAPAQQEAPSAPEPAPGSVAEVPPGPGPSRPTIAPSVPLAEGLPPYAPLLTSIPDLGVPLPIKNPFVHLR